MRNIYWKNYFRNNIICLFLILSISTTSACQREFKKYDNDSIGCIYPKLEKIEIESRQISVFDKSISDTLCFMFYVGFSVSLKEDSTYEVFPKSIARIIPRNGGSVDIFNKHYDDIMKELKLRSYRLISYGAPASIPFMLVVIPQKE